jgi:hypothetical protein
LPCKRSDFIDALKLLGFTGPVVGRRHMHMLYGEYALAIPSYQEYSVDKVREMIREVEGIMGREIALAEWDRLRRGRR